MNYLHVAWASTLGLLFYLVLTEPYLSDLLEIFNKKVFIIWKRFLFEMRWNKKYPWANYLIWKEASKNAEISTRLLREELGLPLDDG
jgi:hypothetical protein